MRLVFRVECGVRSRHRYNQILPLQQALCKHYYKHTIILTHSLHTHPLHHTHRYTLITTHSSLTTKHSSLHTHSPTTHSSTTHSSTTHSSLHNTPQVITGKASREDLQDALTMIRNTSNPQVEYIVRIIKKWCKENNVKIT